MMTHSIHQYDFYPSRRKIDVFSIFIKFQKTKTIIFLSISIFKEAKVMVECSRAGTGTVMGGLTSVSIWG